MSQISAVTPTDETITTNSSLQEISPIPENPIEECDHVILLSSSPLFIDTQRSNSFSLDSIDILNEKSSNTETAVEFDLNVESSNPTMVVVTSPSFNSDLSSEQNDSIDQLNPSSLLFLQTKHRRIDHRRNKSEPVKSASTEDLSPTTTLDFSSTIPTNNDSPSTTEIRKKSTTKLNSNNISPSKTSKQMAQDKMFSSSSTTATPRKKKAWYNVSTTTYLLLL